MDLTHPPKFCTGLRFELDWELLTAPESVANAPDDRGLAAGGLRVGDGMGLSPRPSPAKGGRKQ